VQRVGDGAQKKLGYVAEIGENIYRPMLDGPWEGDDARDVLIAAIDWWEEQLIIIENDISQMRPD